eukprot:XP_016861011.1 T-cell surface protein tactile isoform X4 [Homo sapiens]
MEKKWKYCAVYYIIQIHFVKGVWEKTVNTEENVYATLGSDVNLTCQTQTVGFFVQMQWSKVTNKIDLIAVYHPQYGFYCAYGRPCESLVTFTETPENGSKWTLHLRNMSCSVSGRYECMLVLYPEGIQTKIYNLLIQTHVTADEWNSNHTIEIEINQTLEIPCFQNSSSKISSEFTYAWSVRRFTCLLKNVFPKANITWFIDGSFLHDEKEGIYITNEERKGKDGFLELKSVLTRVHSNKPAQSDNLTIWCMALSPVPGNKVWNISSEKITFLLGSEISSTDPPLSVTESTLDTQPSPASSVSPARYPATSSVTLVDVSALRPNTTPQPSNSSMTTRGFNYPWTSSGTDTKKSVSRIPSETYSSSPSGAGSTLHDNVFTSTARAFSEVPTTANGSTKTNHVHITGIVVNKPKDGMSWPVIVAALLFCCMILFGLGVRKWCQYQKEIMERPPPFKPPPPPIKYTCIQEPNESDLPYHEMETL